MSIKPVVITDKSNIDEVIEAAFSINKIPLRSFKRFGRMKLLVIITRVTLIMSFKDFNNVTLLFDDHEFHAHKVILAVNIAAAFPIGEASPHSTGSSRGVTSLGSGHWRQV